MLKLFQYISLDLSFPDKANICLSSPQSVYYGDNLSLGRDSHLAQRSEQQEQETAEHITTEVWSLYQLPQRTLSQFSALYTSSWLLFSFHLKKSSFL